MGSEPCFDNCPGVCRRRVSELSNREVENMASPRRALDAFFTDQARKYPTRTALVGGEESCTYEELERQAAAIELTLRNARLSGAMPVVGLAYARSTFSYAAVLESCGAAAFTFH